MEGEGEGEGSRESDVEIRLRARQQTGLPGECSRPKEEGTSLSETN